MATWRNGYAEDCKSFYPSSILGVASKKMNKEILKIALNTENLSFLNNHTHATKLKNSVCGDEIKIYLIVKNRKITTFKYEGESCIYCQASASLLSKIVRNKTINEVKLILEKSNDFFTNKKINTKKEFKSFFNIMNKSNIRRKECLLLPVKATLKALKT